MKQDDGYRWHYGSIAIDPADGSSTFSIFQEMSDEEHEQLSRASRLLLAVGPTSSYASLRDQFRLFENVMDDAEADPTSKFQEHGGLLRFSSAVDNVLFAFRAFLDRTAHDLSHAYGKSSPQARSFKEAQKEQFDAALEYRLSYKLRNMSQHVGHVVSNVKARGQRDENDEMQVVAFEVTIDPKKLLASYGEWGPVRRDLEAMDDLIQVRDLVSGLEAACSVLMAHVIVSQESQIVDAVARLRSAAAMCGDATENGAPMAVRVRPGDVAPNSRFTPMFEDIPVEVADLAERNLAVARASLRP